MRTYQIRPLPLASVELDMASFTFGMNWGKKIRATYYCWYIEGADKHILVDTGADVKLAAEYRGYVLEPIASFEDALASIELKPGDIDLIIATHLHWDHCCNTFKCTNAKVVVAEEEMRFSLSPHPLNAAVYHKGLLKDLRFTLVSGRTEIAPGIELIPAPGHTPGTQAVSVNTTQGKAIITGFCSIRENFEPPDEVREIMPVIAPGMSLNAVEAFESALRIKGLADILIPIHDSSFAKIKSIP